MKRILSVLFTLLLLLSLAPAALAADAPVLIDDGAGLLTQAEEQELENLAQDFYRSYDVYVAIVTTNTLGGKSPMVYADDYYDQTFGINTDGLLLLLSMEDRDWYISTSGIAIDTLTDYGAQDSMDSVLPYLSDGDYYDGFALWLKDLPYYFDAWEEGDVVDIDSQPYTPSLPLSMLIGLVVAAVVVLILRSTMNSKRKQHSAATYLTPGTFHLRTHQDFYLYSKTSKTAIPKDSGGSSTHTSSGGGRHGGGGGKF